MQSPAAVPIVPAMVTLSPRPIRLAALAPLLAAALVSCSRETAADPNSRKIEWTYGPTSGTATPEHVAGTGTKGGAAIAKGWTCRLVDGKRLTVSPYQLSSSHPLFGKVALSIGLFDKDSKDIGTVRSGTLTATNASFSFDLADDLAKRLFDVVIWYQAI